MASLTSASVAAGYTLHLSPLVAVGSRLAHDQSASRLCGEIHEYSTRLESMHGETRAN